LPLCYYLLNNYAQLKDIHRNFTAELQKTWAKQGFTYWQVKEWIDLGLQPTDAEFCVWLEQEGYTALSVLNNEDEEELRAEYQKSLEKKPLYQWYRAGKLTYREFTLLTNKLGNQVNQDYSLLELKKILTNTPISQTNNYRYSKLVIVLALGAGIIYLLLKE